MLQFCGDDFGKGSKTGLIFGVETIQLRTAHLFEKLWEYFSPIRKRREELLADKLYVDNVLVRGARRANEVAEEVMTRVRAAVGLG